MAQSCIEVRLRSSRPRLALQLCNVLTIDRTVVHRSSFNSLDSATRGTNFRRRNGQIGRGVSRRSRAGRESSLLDVVHDGLRQAQFAGGGLVSDLVSLLDGAQRGDSAAVLEDNRVRPDLRTRQQERGAKQEEAHSAENCLGDHPLILLF